MLSTNVCAIVLSFFLYLININLRVDCDIGATTSRSDMITTQFSRFIHLSTSRLAASINKANLAKLRKKTGYPFGNCKKALEVSNNDLAKAEKWLEDQAKELGWSKAMKMETRSVPQGLVGVAWEKQYAAMVEINCETDFVAKNDKFQKLVDMVAKTCLQQTKADNPSPKSISKILLEGDDVGKLLASDQESLADHVVKNVAIVGERLVIRRAALVSAGQPIHLSALTHPATTTVSNYSSLLGKYGAIVMYTAASHNDQTVQITRQLCQHVIGMNPTTIEASPDAPKPTKPVVKEKVERVEGEEGEEAAAMVDEEETETAMMRQTFLLDAERTVADVVDEAGIKVQDFVRFECGEGLSDPEEVTTKVAQVG